MALPWMSFSILFTRILLQPRMNVIQPGEGSRKNICPIVITEETAIWRAEDFGSDRLIFINILFIISTIPLRKFVLINFGKKVLTTVKTQSKIIQDFARKEAANHFWSW